ncbi:MAG TPA: MBL fold metallo-hydrolase [Gammaproteobacteria bacterium]|nr:MBL fold metallo-hydrolase [Gammaproteobacteria bacterium]
MGKAYLRFWGVRGSHAAPFPSHLKIGGNTSCVEIRADDYVLICDGGTGIIPLGEKLIAEDGRHEVLIILTHYHWDHICGLPFFQPAFARDWNIRFFGPGENKTDIQRRIADQMKAPYFPVETENWMANIEYLTPGRQGIRHGPMTFSYHNVHHPGVTYGYRITLRGKDIVYISDNEFLFLEKSIAQRYDEFDHEERELLDNMRNEERANELQRIRNADILIHDAQYTPEDYNRKRGWGHSCYVDTVNSAIEAGVKVLYLYHHDPTYDDQHIESMHTNALAIIRERGSHMECHIAREGLIVDL